MDRCRLLGVLYASVLFIVCSKAHAAYATYTSQSDFMVGLTGTAMTLDFEGVTAPYIINSGDTLDGITFNYSFGPPPVDMQVSSSNDTGYATTSGTNYLGTSDFDIFLDDDDFSIDFASSSGIGMYFITAETPNVSLFDGDIQLTADAVTAYLDVDAPQFTLSDGSLVYFLGITDTTASLMSASITTPNSSGSFLYNIDDITVSAVPLPGALWLFGSGLVGLLVFRRKG